MYAPPPFGYAWIVCRYENTTIASIDAMTTPIGVASAQRRDAADHQDAQDLFGRVCHRRQRVRGEHGQTGDPGKPLVVRKV